MITLELQTDSYLVAIYVYLGWEKTGVRLSSTGTHGKRWGKNSVARKKTSESTSIKGIEPKNRRLGALTFELRANSWNSSTHTKSRCDMRCTCYMSLTSKIHRMPFFVPVNREWLMFSSVNKWERKNHRTLNDCYCKFVLPWLLWQPSADWFRCHRH